MRTTPASVGAEVETGNVAGTRIALLKGWEGRVYIFPSVPEPLARNSCEGLGQHRDPGLAADGKGLFLTNPGGSVLPARRFARQLARPVAAEGSTSNKIGDSFSRWATLGNHRPQLSQSKVGDRFHSSFFNFRVDLISARPIQFVSEKVNILALCACHFQEHLCAGASL